MAYVPEIRPFSLSRATEPLSDLLRQRTDAGLAEQARSGDDNALTRLMSRNPQLGGNVYKMQQNEQQQKQQMDESQRQELAGVVGSVLSMPESQREQVWGQLFPRLKQQYGGLSDDLAKWDNNMARAFYGKVVGPKASQDNVFPDATGRDDPAKVATFKFYESLNPEQRKMFESLQRAPTVVNLGGSQGVVNPTGTGLQAEFGKTLAPQDQPEVRGDQARAKKEGEREAEMPQLRRAANSALNSFESQASIVTSTIDQALETISPWSTGYGAMVLSNLPNTEARKLKNQLDTIRANVGFDKLQQMRDASPTGGALGQVSEMENRLLQAVNGALDPMQAEQLPQNLKVIRDLYQQLLQDRKAAFEQDFGGGLVEQQPPNRQPAGTTPPIAEPQQQGGNVVNWEDL